MNTFQTLGADHAEIIFIIDFNSDTLTSPTMPYKTQGIDHPTETIAIEEMQGHRSDNFGVSQRSISLATTQSITMFSSFR